MTKRDEILNYTEKKYGTKPEYPWDNLPTYAILRHDDNDKWYGLIMTVSKERLGLEGEGDNEVIDLKAAPDVIDNLKGTKGYLPAYHMNKEHWISILLDGSVSMKDIQQHIDSSYELTK